MIPFRNPWENSYTIRLVAIIDAAFACLLVTIYVQKLMQPITYYGTPSEIQRLPSLKLFLLGPISFNSFQVVMSLNLFSAARKRCEPLIAYAKATTWFQFSCIVLILLFIKLFLVLWFPPQGSLDRRDIFGVTLIVLETVFKIFGLFIIKEFIDDLKFVLTLFPSPQYYCIYTPAQPILLSTSAASTTSGSPSDFIIKSTPTTENSDDMNLSHCHSYPSSSTTTLVLQDTPSETQTTTKCRNSVVFSV